MERIDEIVRTSPVSFAGTYERRHAVRGLRLQLIPFVALALGLLAVTAASAPLGAGITILLFACFVTIAYFTAASYRRELNKVNLRPPHGSVTGELSADGLVLRDEEREERRAWTEFLRVQVLSSVILLHNHDGSAVLLPAEFFEPASWRHAKRIARATSAAKAGAIPPSLKMAFLALCAALVFLYAFYLLSRAAR
jgi:hypothetical protein